MRSGASTTLNCSREAVCCRQQDRRAVAGCVRRDSMVAFCLCIPGLKPGGRPYLHSHMLGVLPQYRNTGLGRRMKLVQREYALANHIDLIEWTFDPLEIKNAFFNIERLGAMVRRYIHNQYGTTTSHLHGGLPTDRLTAEWWVQSPRVLAACAGSPPPVLDDGPWGCRFRSPLTLTDSVAKNQRLPARRKPASAASLMRHSWLAWPSPAFVKAKSKELIF